MVHRKIEQKLLPACVRQAGYLVCHDYLEVPVVIFFLARNCAYARAIDPARQQFPNIRKFIKKTIFRIIQCFRLNVRPHVNRNHAPFI